MFEESNGRKTRPSGLPASRSASLEMAERCAFGRLGGDLGQRRATEGVLDRRHGVVQPPVERTFATVAELVAASGEFKRTYDERWVIRRHGHRTPSQARRDLAGSKSAAA